MRGQLRWATVDGAARPWLVVQAEILTDDDAPTVIAMPVTLTPQDAGWPFTVRLEPHDTGFPQPSWARVTLLRSLRREQLEEPIATLLPPRLDDITTSMAALLGIEPVLIRNATRYRRRPGAAAVASEGEDREPLVRS